MLQRAHPQRQQRLYSKIFHAATRGRLNLLQREQMDALLEQGEKVAEHPLHRTDDLAESRDLLMREGEQAGLSRQTMRDLTLCAGEACTNALVHGKGGE